MNEISPTVRIIFIGTPRGAKDALLLQRVTEALEVAKDRMYQLAEAADFAGWEARVLIRMYLEETLPKAYPHKFTSDEPWRRQGKRKGRVK